MELAQLQQTWTARGFSYTVWTDPPGQVWANFVHAVDELVTLVEGEIELTFQGHTLRPHIGEEVIIPAGVPHTVRNTGATTNRWCFGYKREDETKL
jgi:quercetin dioxygenase-like cupin family protein